MSLYRSHQAIEKFISNCRERLTTVRVKTEKLQLIDIQDSVGNAACCLLLLFVLILCIKFENTMKFRIFLITFTFLHISFYHSLQAIERFASNCRERSTTVRALTEELQLMEMPNNAENATMLLIEQRKRRMEVKEDLTSAVKYGQTLLSCLRKVTGDGKEKNPDKLLTTCAIEK